MYSIARAWRSKIGLAIALDLLRVGLAVEHAERAAVARRGLDLEVAGDERKQIGRAAARFRRSAPSTRSLRRGLRSSLGAVADHLPLGRPGQRQRPPRLEVRLIEHRQRQVRACRDEQRVEEVGVAVERRVAGREGHVDRVPPGLQRGGGDDDVAVDPFEGRVLAVGRDALDVLAAGREVDDQRLRAGRRART